MPLIEYPRATPIHVIGDSHVFAFSNRVVAADSGEVFAFRALFCPELPTRVFMPDSEPDQRLVALLESARLLVRGENGLEGAHRGKNPLSRWVRTMDEQDGVEPALVISTGSLDIIEIIEAIGESDFVLPADVRDDPATPQDCKEHLAGALPEHEVARIFAEPFQPLRTLLRFLRERGLTRLAVLGLTPITTDNEVYRRALTSLNITVRPGQTESTFRRKLVVGVNSVLKTLCADEGVAFVDRWSSLTQRGEPLPGILLDVAHVTRDAATAAVADLVALFAAPSPRGGGFPALDDVAAAQRSLRHGVAVEDFALAGERLIVEPRLTALHSLAAVQQRMRVLEIGGGSATLGSVFAEEGAHVTALSSATDLHAQPERWPNGSATFDRVIAHDAVERLSAAGLDRFYASVRNALRPDGEFIVYSPLNWRRMEYEQRPTTLLHRLKAVFPHVLVWIATPDEPAGTLARDFSRAEVERSGMLFALASPRTLDASAIARRMTSMDPLPDLGEAVELRDPSIPERVAIGEPFLMTVTLANSSPARLASQGPDPVRFAYFWTDPRGSLYDRGNRARIALASAPGSTRRYGLKIIAPDEPGRWGLRLTLIQENVRWFSSGIDIALSVG